jgi:hypothetical protein
MGRHQRDCRGHEHPVGAEDGHCGDEEPPHVPAAVSMPRPPEEHDAECDEHHPGGAEHEARPVVAARADGAGAGDGEREALECKNAEREREDGADPRTRAHEDGGAGGEQRRRHEAAREVVGRLHTRLERDEAVRHGVNGDGKHRSSEEP